MLTTVNISSNRIKGAVLCKYQAYVLHAIMGARLWFNSLLSVQAVFHLTGRPLVTWKIWIYPAMPSQVQESPAILTLSGTTPLLGLHKQPRCPLTIAL